LINDSSGFGPGIDGLFFQSNLGVVTKMGIHLQPAPHHFLDCQISVPNEDDLPVLVSTLAHLERSGIIQNHASVSNPFRQAVCEPPEKFGPMVQYWATQKAVPYSVLENMQQENGWGFWKAEFALYGSKLMCDAAWKEVQAAFEEVPGVQFHAAAQSAVSSGGPLVPSEMDKPAIPHSGFPSIGVLPMMDIRGKPGAHTCFSPLFPPGGQQLHQWYLRSKKLVEDANIDYFSDFHVYGRYVIAIIVLIYGPGHGPRVDRLYKELMDDAANEKVSEYRTHIDYMDEIAGHYNWNNGAQRRFLQKIKDVTDPKGILSQGKSGIWNAGHQKTTV
jgi:4-cresol dehydrogenase (hydroxylating)